MALARSVATRRAPLPPRAALRWDVVRREVDALAPRSVLEVGCGQGAMGARLSVGHVRRYDAVEPDAQSFAVAHERIRAEGATVINGDHTAAPRDDYDLVIACEVLEHVEADHEVLAEWVRLVRPGGHLLLSVPAWPRRFAPMDVRAGHYRRYSPQDISEVMQRAGLIETRTTLYAWPLGYALETVRNRIDARFLANLAARGATADITGLTAGSGRHMQPTRLGVGRAVEALSAPFVRMQRLAPARGTGLVSVGRRPDG